jgi:branched-chain amino acid transport system ATP-binding protein
MSVVDEERPLLAIRNLDVTYGRGVVAIRGVSLVVPAGRTVALLGANGAGKTTLLRAISGLLTSSGGRTTRGTVHLDGERIDRLRGQAIVARGVAHVMEGRRIFAELTVEENLRAGGYRVRAKRELNARLEVVFEMFPRLAERRRGSAGYLSGGEQQMLALGRAIMQRPRLLLLDEPSLGLAPRVVQHIRETIALIASGGTAILLVEQNAGMALELADTGYVLQTGRMVRQGPAGELLADPRIREFYLGIAAEPDERVRPAVVREAVA